MASYTFYSGTADGYVLSEGASYAVARGGTGTLSASTAGTTFPIGQQEFFGYRVWESFIGFDTSSIPDSATVSSATLSLYGSADTSTVDFTVDARDKDWGGTVTTADFVAGASLSGQTLRASKSTAGGWSTSAYNDLTSEAGFPGGVSKTGTTYLILNSRREVDNSTPAAGQTNTVDCYSADDSGTTRDPKLVVVDDTSAGSPWYAYLQQ